MGITRDDLASGEETLTITKKRAIQEYRAHGLLNPEAELVADLGNHETYDAGAVLRALGY